MRLPPDSTKLIDRGLVVRTLGALRAQDALRALTPDKIGTHLVLRGTDGKVAYTSRRLSPEVVLAMVTSKQYQGLRDADFDEQGYIPPHPAALKLALRGQRLYRGEMVATLRESASTLKFHLWRYGRRADLSHLAAVTGADFSLTYIDRLQVSFLAGPVVFTQQIEDMQEATFQHGPLHLLPGCKVVLHKPFFGSDVVDLRYLNPGAKPRECEDATHDVGLCGCFVLGPGLPLTSRGADIQVLARAKYVRQK